MSFHRDQIDADIHAITSKTFTDIAERDADTDFNSLTANLNKIVRVDSPLSFYILVATTPTWESIGSTLNDSFLELLDAPSSYSGQGSKVLQVNGAESAVEFGQALTPSSDAAFDNLILASGDITGATGVDVIATTGNVDLTSPAGNIELSPLLSVILNTNVSVDTTTGALRLPRLTPTQRDALTPLEGMTIFNTTIDAPEFFNGVVWKSSGGAGDVIGPASSIDNQLTRFNGVTGKIIQTSGVIIDDLDNMTKVLTLEIGNATLANPSSQANDLVVETIGDTGVTLFSPDANVTSLVFGSPSGTGNEGARIRWSFTSDLFSIVTTQANSEIIIAPGFLAEAMRFKPTGEVLIGTSSLDASALLNLSSITKGFLSPRMTTTQRDDISTPATGLQIYNTTTSHPNVFDSTDWRQFVLLTPAGDLTLTGDIIIDGTVDGVDIGVDVPANTTHRLSDGKNHSDVVLNNTHRSSDGSDHTFLDQSVTILSTPTFLKAVIGTTVTPDGTLHVHTGSAGGVTALSVANALVVEDSTNNGISILTPDASSGRIVFGSPSDPFGAFMAWSFSVDDFVVGTSKIGANFRLTSDQETTNLTLSGAGGSELATFAKDVAINGTIKIKGGTPAIDRVLTSIDTDGNATWQVPVVSVGWIAAGSTVSLNDPADNVRIGIGPDIDSKLHVTSGTAGTVTAFSGTIATFESSGAGYLSILTPDVSTSGILFGEPSSNLAGAIFYNDPGSPDGFQFRVNGNQTKMVIESDGAVGIGTTNPDFTSILDLSSTTEGFLSPRMTETQRDAISSPATGLKIYNTTVDKYEIFTGTVWKTFLTEDLGSVVAQETFASVNVRFFGELGVPQSQQTWVDTATGTATIDLQTQLVFGVSKQVVRHNDDTAGGSTTSKITLTTQNWLDINNFGASYSGISRLDTVDGVNGFFSGLQANSAENPLATGNRRYGILFSSNLGNLKLIEADNNPGNSVTMDGTGGNPLIPFDQFFSWECLVPAGLGAAQVFIDGTLTTFVPLFLVNGGGLGTQIIISSGSTGGTDRITYHDNFGVTIFEESATKTLSAASMASNVAQVNIPEGRRDYTIILPDGNPRELGSVLRAVANNLFGKITLTNQNPAAPEILYNGLRTLVIDVFAKEILGGINTVDQGNVYVGFKDEPISQSQTIFAQLSSSLDQIPTTTSPTVITYNTHEELSGIGHDQFLDTGEITVLPGKAGVYLLSARPQVGKDSGGVKVDFDMFLQINTGSGFVDENNSNIKLTIKDSDITDVIVSAFALPLNVGDKVRMMQRVSDSTVGMGLKFTEAEVGPPTVPRVPSVILTMFRLGGI